jgi:hypothetical protein
MDIPAAKRELSGGAPAITSSPEAAKGAWRTKPDADKPLIDDRGKPILEVGTASPRVSSFCHCALLPTTAQRVLVSEQKDCLPPNHPLLSNETPQLRAAAPLGWLPLSLYFMANTAKI